MFKGRCRLFYLILLLFITSCKNRTSVLVGKQTEYLFVFQPKSNSKCYYNFLNSTISEQQLNNEWKKITNTAEISIVYDIKQDTLGGYVIHLGFDQIRLSIENQDGSKKEMDAATAAGSSDLADKPFALFKDARFIVILNKKKEIVALQGYDEFISRLKKSIVSDERNKQMLESTLNELMGPDFIRRNIEQQCRLFPDTAIQIGDTWRKQVDDHTGMNIHGEDVYTLRSVKNGIATVGLNSEINMENEKIKVAGYDANVSLTGERNGEISADTKTGMLIKSKIEQFLKGEIEVMGKNVPVNIKSTFEVVKHP